MVVLDTEPSASPSFVQRCCKGAVRAMTAAERRDRSRAFGATSEGACRRQSGPLMLFKETTELGVFPSNLIVFLVHLTSLFSLETNIGLSRTLRDRNGTPPTRALTDNRYL